MGNRYAIRLVFGSSWLRQLMWKLLFHNQFKVAGRIGLNAAAEAVKSNG